jgi:alpha-N-arabinofuranosidase
MKAILRSVVAAAAVISLAAQSEADIHASAAIDTRAPGVRIAPEIYGQFAEQLGEGITGGIWVGEDSAIPNIHGYRRDVVEALQALHVPVLRWPGGCYADTYHWRDGIGPRLQRPVTLNRWWGNNEEHNAFGTQEYFNFAELIGAKTFLSINVGTGTAGEAKDWVEYVTSPSHSTLAQLRRSNGREQPWKIDFAGIGNESWGCGGNLSANQYAPLMRNFGNFVRQDQGPKIVSVGPSADDYGWTQEIMKSHTMFDYLSLHYYTIPTGDWLHKGSAVGFSKDEWARTFAQTRRIEEMIARHSAIMDKSDPDKNAGLAVDEWGTWYDTPSGAPALRQDNTLRDALVAATNFHIFNRHADRVRMANIAQMVNVLQAMILTDGVRMVRTPTYFAFQMYQPFQGATAFPVTINSPDFASGASKVPAVDVSAARGTDGATYVALVNVDPTDRADVELGLGEAKHKQGRVSGQVLTAAKMDSMNHYDAPDEVRPAPFTGARWTGDKLKVVMPAKSVVVLKLQ